MWQNAGIKKAHPMMSFNFYVVDLMQLQRQ